MNALVFERALARIYTERRLRRQLLVDPRGVARRLGLSPEQADTLARIDRDGLALAAESFARKRRDPGGH